MKHRIIVAAFVPLPALAALAPVHQNPKDLNVMVAFVLKHPDVVQSLRSIDFQSRTVHYGQGCIARFGRVAAPSVPGPAPALEFKSSTCPLGPSQ